MQKTNRKLASAAVALTLALSATQAQAVELITNGSFETGTLAGWSSNAPNLNPFGTTYGSGMDGTYWHWLSGYEQNYATSQLVNGLVAGTTYNLTFLMASEYTNQDSLRVSVDGGLGTIFTAPSSYGVANNFWDNWVAQLFSFTATGTSATIQFDSNGLNANGYDVGFDRVSLQAAQRAEGAVPEPGTWAMMLLGFGGMGVALRRRRKSAYIAQLA